MEKQRTGYRQKDKLSDGQLVYLGAAMVELNQPAASDQSQNIFQKNAKQGLFQNRI